MLKGFKRKLPLLIAVALVMSTPIACSKKTASSSASTETATKEAEKPRDLGGRTIQMLQPWGMKPKPGTPISDEIFERIATMEKKNNFKWAWCEAAPQGDYVQFVISNAMAGTPSGDWVHIQEGMLKPLVKAGALVDMSKLKSFDGFKDTTVWSKLTVDLGTIDGKIYGVKSNPLPPGNTVFWNKTMFKNAGLPDLYQLQKEGNWTYDKFLEFAKVLTKDTDGDGKIDRWGTVLSSIIAELGISNGSQVVAMKDGKATLTLNDPKTLKGFEFLQKLVDAKVMMPNKEGSQWDAYRTDFANGKIAMMFSSSGAASVIKDMKDDFGYILGPKGPDTKDYVSDVIMEYDTMPISVKNPDDVAFIINQYNQPWNVNKGDGWKVSSYPSFRDKESVDITKDAMRNGNALKYDNLNLVGDSFNQFVGEILNGKSTPAASLEKYKSVMQATVDKYNSGN